MLLLLLLLPEIAPSGWSPAPLCLPPPSTGTIRFGGKSRCRISRFDLLRWCPFSAQTSGAKTPAKGGMTPAVPTEQVHSTVGNCRPFELIAPGALQMRTCSHSEPRSTRRSSSSTSGRHAREKRRREEPTHTPAEETMRSIQRPRANPSAASRGCPNHHLTDLDASRISSFASARFRASSFTRHRMARRVAPSSSGLVFSPDDRDRRILTAPVVEHTSFAPRPHGTAPLRLAPQANLAQIRTNHDQVRRGRSCVGQFSPLRSCIPCTSGTASPRARGRHLRSILAVTTEWIPFPPPLR